MIKVLALLVTPPGGLVKHLGRILVTDWQLEASGREKVIQSSLAPPGQAEHEEMFDWQVIRS